MTTERDDDDARLDALVRAASARDVDAAAIKRRVNERLATRGGTAWRLPAFGPQLAVAGFATMLIAAGLAGYSAPDLLDYGIDQQMLMLAFGDPEAAGATFPSDALGAAE